MTTFIAMPKTTADRPAAAVSETGRPSSPNPLRMSGRWKRAWSKGQKRDVVEKGAVRREVRQEVDRGKGGGRRK